MDSCGRDTTPGKPTKRRYSREEKAAVVRMVRTLRAELGTQHGTIQQVAAQLGYGTESVRSWVRQADIDEGMCDECAQGADAATGAWPMAARRPLALHLGSLA
jgi:transposase-like protein